MTTAKSERSLTQVVITNTAFNILGKSWGIIIALFLTPYTISCIGVERYGVWALVSVVTSYFGLLDLGIGSSYVKYIAEYHTKRDCLQINRIVNSGLAFYGVFMRQAVPAGIDFRGSISDAELRRLYTQADIFVSPTWKIPTKARRPSTSERRNNEKPLIKTPELSSGVFFMSRALYHRKRN